MATLSAQCGHCGRDVALEIVAEYPVSPADPPGSSRHRLWAAFTRCFACSQPGFAVLEAPLGPFPCRPMHGDRDLKLLGWKEIRREPKPRPPDTPAHLPEDVRLAFTQAARATTRPDDADLAILGCRRTLEVALAAKGATDGPLAARIRALADRGELTRDLADWADHIRLLGNEAAHGPVLGKEGAHRAKALVEFTRLVLVYLFTLPEEVRRAREQAGDAV